MPAETKPFVMPNWRELVNLALLRKVKPRKVAARPKQPRLLRRRIA